jgi:hypothetical protein
VGVRGPALVMVQEENAPWMMQDQTAKTGGVWGPHFN